MRTMWKLRLVLHALMGVMVFDLFPNLEAQDALAVGRRDIIFLIDSSMGTTLVGAVREFIRKFIDSMPIGPDQVQVGVAMFSTTPKMEINFNSFDSKESLLSALDRIKPRPSSEVNIGAALDFVRTDMLRLESGSRIQQRVPQLVLLLTSKKSKDSVQQSAEALRQMGVLTLAVGSRSADEDELKHIAFDESQVFMLKDFRILTRNPQKIFSSLSTLSAVIESETPTETALAVGRRDIIFLIDSSLGTTLVGAVREFIRKFIDSMTIGPDQVQVGVAMFSTTPKMEINFNSFNSKESLLSALDRIKPRPSSEVNIGAALDFVRTDMLRLESGSRIQQRVPQLVMLLTSKKSKDNVQQSAEALRQMGVLTLAAGSRSADEDELKHIAFDESQVFMLKDFRILTRNPQKIFSSLSTLSAVIESETPTETALAVGRRDIIFLIDSSMGTTLVGAVREFIRKFIDSMPIGPDQVQVGVAMFSTTPKMEINFNSFDSKESLLSALDRIKPRPSSEVNIGAALDFVRTDMLRPESGSRIQQRVPQLVLLLTSKKSKDSVQQSANAIRQMGVLTLAAGSRSADEAELKQIAFDESQVFMLKDFRILTRNPQKIFFSLSTLSAVIESETPTETAFAVGRRDIIFLIDSSMGTTIINAVREFIRKFIDSMPIGPDQVQVGVAMFSSSPKMEINFNSFDSKESLISALLRIKPRPSSEVNIGAALDFVRTDMLRPESGSRIQQRVPQLVLLLTSKKSKDSVQQSAEALRQMGVLTLAAGSRSADEAELKQIAFDESLTFLLKDFRILTRNPQKIVSSLSTLSAVIESKIPNEKGPVVDVTTVQAQKVVRDILFVVDGSSYVGNANIKYVQDFISGVVNRLDVQPERVRIALMQFDEGQRTEFYFNTHKTKQDVLSSIAQLSLMGGRALNTGAALQYALSNHFQASAGSRKRPGIQQVLVLITGGPSQFEAKSLADRVALAGVLTFAVGAGQVEESFLKTVAFEKDLAYYRRSFTELSSIIEEILTPLVNVVGKT
ncbi:collagen alpha-3(VI) chain-like [Triplophysa dalaica]|uniref:collagen alpha-3(VI) chain-like n=1 Tax=Triplophysa dalaica TaxID=1582913 RepID=UPI0024DFE4CE|nr:collagen alpha-3(VI) chain-like [Triplophysa dalaica]XP_056611534.1 collagen alpha-3(VI) chain-like [Triplophysa dalaica]XP_056611535.1 collagen alpha-3(VI) chain-like [Triplophysa dalaica]XP_056611536.1 collagen alpha-3(VI) chain-like [Triplophysa dalaica]